jgi:hypothetical protein
MVRRNWSFRIGAYLIACGVAGGCAGATTQERAPQADGKTRVEDRPGAAGSSDVTSVPIANVDPASKKGTLRAGVVRDSFADGTKVTSTEVIQMGNQYYLTREGQKDGNCYLEGTPLKEDNGVLTIAKARGALKGTTTCSGKPCSKCTFVRDGDITVGCDCKDTAAGHFCNHTITGSTTWSALLASSRPDGRPDGRSSGVNP